MIPIKIEETVKDGALCTVRKIIQQVMVSSSADILIIELKGKKMKGYVSKLQRVPRGDVNQSDDKRHKERKCRVISQPKSFL